MKVRWVDENWSAETVFLFYNEGQNDIPRAIVTDIRGGRCTLERYEQGAIIKEPTLRMDARSATEFIQSFLDEAWDKGFRPTKEKKTREQIEREMARLEYHLEDMRALVFGKKEK